MSLLTANPNHTMIKLMSQDGQVFSLSRSAAHFSNVLRILDGEEARQCNEVSINQSGNLVVNMDSDSLGLIVQFLTMYDRLGKSIEGALEDYDSFLASMKRQVLVDLCVKSFTWLDIKCLVHATHDRAVGLEDGVLLALLEQQPMLRPLLSKASTVYKGSKEDFVPSLIYPLAETLEPAAMPLSIEAQDSLDPLHFLNSSSPQNVPEQVHQDEETVDTKEEQAVAQPAAAEQPQPATRTQLLIQHIRQNPRGVNLNFLLEFLDLPEEGQGTPESAPGSIVHATKFDKLPGRGQGSYGSSGNQNFSKIRDELFPVYEALRSISANNKMKQDLSRVFMTRFHATGGRFLKEGANDSLVVMKEAEALKVCSQAFRTQNNQPKKVQKKQAQRQKMHSERQENQLAQRNPLQVQLEAEQSRNEKLKIHLNQVRQENLELERAISLEKKKREDLLEQYVPERAKLDI